MNNQKKVLDGLAQRFVNYQNLVHIPIRDNGDVMVDARTYGLISGLQYSKLPASTGEYLLLRKEVCQRLAQAQTQLEQQKPGYQLAITYAYRSMEIQEASFEEMKHELGFGDRTDSQAMESTHHFIAVPEVAGHPTGAAVDLLVLDDKGQPLDFGTEMHTLEQNSYAYSPYISDDATINRKLLRTIMQENGFAPYDGEWWHFSYGDREWAAYYGEQTAFYKQLYRQDFPQP